MVALRNRSSVEAAGRPAGSRLRKTIYLLPNMFTAANMVLGILAEIQAGSFAREFVLENLANRPVYNSLLRNDSQHLIEKVGTQVRSMFSWSKK